MQCTMNRLICHLPWLALGTLVACNTPGPAPLRSEETAWLKPEAPRPTSLLEASLAYYAHARTLGPAEWTRENEALKEAVARTPADFHRLRQALLLLSPAAPAKETGRLAPLLERLEKDTQRSTSGLHPLVVLLRAEVEERRRLEEKLRDESKKNEELEQKLEALKAIEKNLIERRRLPPPVSKP